MPEKNEAPTWCLWDGGLRRLLVIYTAGRREGVFAGQAGSESVQVNQGTFYSLFKKSGFVDRVAGGGLDL